MRRVAAGVIASVILGCLVLTGCGTFGSHVSRSSATNGALGVGTTVFAANERQSAPLLAGTTLDGTRLSLDASRTHQIVVVNVWASWCAPCRDESPALAEMAKRMQPSGVRFVGIDEQDKAAAARAFVATTHSTYPHLVDQDGSLLRTLRLLPQAGVPSTLVLDHDGRMAARVIGPTTSPALQRILNGLLAEA